MSQTLHQRIVLQRHRKWLGDELNDHVGQDLMAYRLGDSFVIWTCIAIALGFVLGALLT